MRAGNLIQPRKAYLSHIQPCFSLRPPALRSTPFGSAQQAPHFLLLQQLSFPKLQHAHHQSTNTRISPQLLCEDENKWPIASSQLRIVLCPPPLFGYTRPLHSTLLYLSATVQRINPPRAALQSRTHHHARLL
ncbi:hypothetical protein VHEMI00878 [[Torrubiella] hemipterigena]|uniref:Uncharacterized protein n=1 Tax=[Torrubiella] hemipterigena TaxID=1531966 RepID=A0A0A1T5U8_9HYPO|nr:hypothetical protein VHEMI00878 [[Torrubiella] hemipterigena]